MRPLDISTDSATSGEEEKKRGIEASTTFCVTPNTNSNLRIVPRRKLSVFHRSFDVQSLQITRDEKDLEKRRSVSTPDQEEDHERKENKNSISRTSLLNSYRSALNSTDSSADSISPPKNSCQDEEVFDLEPAIQKKRPLILAQSKLFIPEKVGKTEVRRFDETRVISKVEPKIAIEKDSKVFENVTFRKRVGSSSSIASDYGNSREEINSVCEKKKDSRSSGGVTFNKAPKELTTPASPLLFDSVERIDETIYSGNSSISLTSGESSLKMNSSEEKNLGEFWKISISFIQAFQGGYWTSFKNYL